MRLPRVRFYRLAPFNGERDRVIKVYGPPSRTGRTSPPHVRVCKNSSQGSSRSGLSSSMKRFDDDYPPLRASTGGERLVQKVPHGNWKTVTFIAALRHDRVTAPFALKGSMAGEMFKASTEQCLAPTVKKGDIVFMDNVSVHNVDGIEEAIEARGAIPFYLPAYSPDLNPIEQLFANLKAR
jgi:hypothetical protein